MALVVAALGALLLLVGGLALWALARLHDLEESVALHELALGHLTEPPPPQADQSFARTPLRLLRSHGA